MVPYIKVRNTDFNGYLIKTLISTNKVLSSYYTVEELRKFEKIIYD